MVVDVLFSEKFDVDDRVPQLFFGSPFGGEIGVASHSNLFWLQNFLLLSFQALTNILIAVFVYFLVLKRRGSPDAYLIGYGIVCPFLVYAPFRVVEFFGLQNTTLMMCVAGGNPAILIFRCLETMHGTLPPFAEKSFSQFVLYNASVLQFNFDPKTQEVIPFTRKEFFQRSVAFVRQFVEVTMLFNLLIPRSFVLFPTRPVEMFLDYFYWENLLNNFIMALLMSLVVDAGSTGLGILTSLATGLSTMGVNNKPLTASQSPSDFWGKRWNKIVGSALRRGVFRPMRKGGFSPSVAALGTFLASGLLHEYVLSVMSVRGGTRPSYHHEFGSHLFFFFWNGVVLVGEHFLSNHPLIQWMKKNLPRPIRTALVLLLVLPVSHCFTDEYIASGFFEDAAHGFPKFFF